MTNALCCSCSEIKHGALNPCPRCGAEATGNTTLNINFSDHFLVLTTLEQFGAIIKTINRATDDAQLRFYTFIEYVFEHHPTILTYAPSAPVAERIWALLSGMSLPSVEIVLGYRVRNEGEKRDKAAERDDGKPPWWQFWGRGS